MKTTTMMSITLSFIMLTASSTAKIYKWVDSDGHLNYTERPAPPGIKAEIIEDKLRFGIDLAHKKSSRSSYLETLDKDEAKEQKPEDKQQKIADEQKKVQDSYREKLKKYCETQRNNLKLLKTSSPIAWEENGKTELLSSEQKKEKLKEIASSIEKNCSSTDSNTQE